MWGRFTGLGAALIAALFFISSLGPAVADDGHRHGGFGWGHAIFGSAMMIVFWGGLILVIVLLVRWLGTSSFQRRSHPPQESAAHDILRERVARGEKREEGTRYRTSA